MHCALSERSARNDVSKRCSKLTTCLVLRTGKQALSADPNIISTSSYAELQNTQTTKKKMPCVTAAVENYSEDSCFGNARVLLQRLTCSSSFKLFPCRLNFPDLPRSQMLIINLFKRAHCAVSSVRAMHGSERRVVC